MSREYNINVTEADNGYIISYSDNLDYKTVTRVAMDGEQLTATINALMAETKMKIGNGTSPVHSPSKSYVASNILYGSAIGATNSTTLTAASAQQNANRWSIAKTLGFE